MKKAPLKIAAVLALAVFGRSAQAQDVISIPASTTGLGPNPTSVTIPISITDVAGTALNESSAAGSKIRGINVKINYSPAAAVTSASISIPAATAGNPCSNATGATVLPGSGSGFVRTSIQWLTEATGPVFTEGTAQPCLALTLNFDAPNFPPAGVTLTIDPSNAFTSLTNNLGTTIECVATNQGCSGLTLSASGTVTPVHLTKFDAE